MCEARVFIEKEGKVEKLMDNVVTIKPESGRLLLVDLFGEQRFVDARIKELRLLEHEVVLEQNSE